jgi:hypothetical protein
MKSKKSVLMLLAIIALIVSGVILAQAQRTGFHVGIAGPPAVQHFHPGFHPGFGFHSRSGFHPGAGFHPGFGATVNPPLIIPGFSHPVVVPFTAAPVTGFVTSPVQPFGWFPPVQPPVVVVPPKFREHRGRGFVRGGVVVNPSPVISVPPALGSGPSVVSAGPSGIPMFPAGTSRAQVLAQLGNPVVTVVTSANETLYFSGGVTVIIQNGQVVTGPR